MANNELFYTSDGTERRFVTFSDLKVRSLSRESRKLAGRAIVFDSPGTIPGSPVTEVIRPSAVRRSLDGGDDILALVNHDTGRVLARRSRGTLRLVPDATGVSVEIDVPNTREGDDAIENVRNGNYPGMSFAFFDAKFSLQRTGDRMLRSIHDMRIGEVSVVSMPVYQQTEIHVRALQGFLEDLKQGHSVNWAERQIRLAKAR